MEFKVRFRATVPPAVVEAEDNASDPVCPKVAWANRPKNAAKSGVE